MFLFTFIMNAINFVKYRLDYTTQQIMMILFSHTSFQSKHFLLLGSLNSDLQYLPATFC